MHVTVGIKALNEERNIAAAVASALKAVAPFHGEVVLADSGSSDKTVEIARKFGIRIVQLANFHDRSCGAGAQLAFQVAKGQYFYLMDGDMVMAPDFLERGIQFLEQNPDYAGVGGLVIEMNTGSQEFAIRANSNAPRESRSVTQVDRLDCGGLYRRSAIEKVGYFADRNLHSFEEFELAVRLRSRKWKLARINIHAVDHFGHQVGGYRLLRRRLASGYMGGTGEVLRGALGQAHLPLVIAKFSHVRNSCIVISGWIILIAAILLAIFSSPLWFLACLLAFALAIAVLSYRRGSLGLGLYSLASWNVTAIGLVTGFFRARKSPERPLAYKELEPGTVAAAK